LFGLLKGRRGRNEEGEPFLEEGEKREERDDHLKIRKRQRRWKKETMRS
jgi:hypothetical protein